METLSFSFDPSDIDRQALLTQAAAQIDARRSRLGTDDPELPTTPEGDLVRDLMTDQAEFAGFPEIYPITDQSFLTQGFQVPTRFSQLEKNFNFFWCYFPIVLFPRHNWAFNRIEVQIKMVAPDGGAHLQPKAFQILPNTAFQTLLEANMGLEVRLDENAELHLSPLPLDTPAGAAQANVAAKLAGQMGMVAGPFVYKLKKAKIQHSATGAERVFWRIDGSEFFQENTPEFIIVSQVPKVVDEVRIEAGLRAYRYFNFAAASLQQAVKALPETLKGFFQRGAPVWDAATFDISSKL